MKLLIPPNKAMIEASSSSRSTDFIEKRGFSRATRNTALTLFFNNENNELEGMCRDISDKGIGILTDHALPIGTQCKLKIHDGRTHDSKYQAIIEIVRVTECIDNDGDERYSLGALILQTF